MEAPSKVEIRSVSKQELAGCTPTEWRNHVQNIQKARMTPEALVNLQQKAMRHQRATKAYHEAAIMERCNVLSARAQETSLRKANYFSPSFQQLNAVSAPPSFVTRVGHALGYPGGFTAPPSAAPLDNASNLAEITMQSSATSSNIRSVINHRKARKASSKAEFGSRMAEDQDEEQDFMMVSAQLNQMAEQVEVEEKVVAALPAQLGVAAEAVPETFESLLESIALEPKDAAELAAKFTIYENYLDSVVTIREETVDFWSENKDQFFGAALAAGEAAIRDIDNENSMSINEHSRKWFVYFMMQKAHQNSAAIGRTLAGIKAKLELLTQEELECPFCLDAITAENGTTLGCCHKTCSTCWKKWQELKGARAFCPLCRHQEFVSELFEG